MSDHEPKHRPWRLGVRALLLLVVLVPTAGMVIMSTQAAAAAVSEREASDRVRAHAGVLSAILDVRLAVSAEERQSTLIAYAVDYGIDVDASRELGAIRNAAVMGESRAVVDSGMAVASVERLAPIHERLAALRLAIDDRTAGYADVLRVFEPLRSNLDLIWKQRLAALEAELGAERFSGGLHERTENLAATYEALTLNSERGRLATELYSADRQPDTYDRLLDATSNYDYVVRDFRSSLGPAANDAWIAYVRDVSRRRFDETLSTFTDEVLENPQSPLATGTLDPEIFLQSFGSAAEDSAAWLAGLSDVVQAATEDLQQQARIQASDSSSALRNQVASALGLLTLAIIGAVVLGRSLTRPIHRLEQAAKQVHDGEFDLEPLPATGPRELADSAAAFNEMATTLATVESQAVALADDPGSSVLAQMVPGRTGRSLQVAMNRLRASIQGAEQQRLDLEHAATHDGLTGLLNRAAALPRIERRLAQGRAERRSTMVLFIDLDGLKKINDEHGGHEAGDEGIRLMAEALRACTREADVVARIGGDEFLVAGDVDSASEVEAVAERIRVAVASSELVVSAGPLPLRCSIGMAVSHGDTASVDELIKDADLGLYLAKRDGRNCARWGVEINAHAT